MTAASFRPVPEAHQLRDPFMKDSSSRALLATVGDKWVVLIVLALEQGQLRFGQLAQEIAGISEKMLAQRLRTLVHDGLLVRTSHDEVPPRVSYSLTILGHSAVPVAREIYRWTMEHITDVAENRRAWNDAAATLPPQWRR